MSASGVARARVEVPLDQARAFEAFTAEIGDWYVIRRFSVPEGIKVVTVRIEPHIGGRLIYVEDADTGDGATAGRITCWNPPLGFAFVDASGLEVAVGFEPLAGGCGVTVEVSGFGRLDPGQARQAREHSWHRYLPIWFHDHATRKKATS